MNFWEFANSNPVAACVIAFFGMWAVIGGTAMLGAGVAAFREAGKKKK